MPVEEPREEARVAEELLRLRKTLAEESVAEAQLA